jgi:hypothetical protein
MSNCQTLCSEFLSCQCASALQIKHLACWLYTSSLG